MKGALFADSGYWIALLHPRDQMHERAMSAAAGLGDVPIVTTQMALAEVLNHLSKKESDFGIWPCRWFAVWKTIPTWKSSRRLKRSSGRCGEICLSR